MKPILINPFDAPGHKSVSRNILVPNFVHAETLKKPFDQGLRERNLKAVSSLKQLHFGG